MTTTPQDPVFKTSDLYFAAYLQTAGVEMKGTERVEGNKILFVFDTTVTDIAALKTAWYNNTGKVAANPFAYNIKTLKSVCHWK